MQLITLCLQDLWGGDSQLQTQGTWDPTVDLANNVAEVALQESAFPDPTNEGLSAVPFQDVDGQAPREPAFQETGAADSSEDEATPKDLPAWTCSCVPPVCFVSYGRAVYNPHDRNCTEPTAWRHCIQVLWDPQPQDGRTVRSDRQVVL